MMQSLCNLLFPTANVCHLCGRALQATQDCLCGRCTHALEQCRISPMERSDLVGGRWQALSAFWYQEQARKLVHHLKFQSDLAAARPLADQMTVVLVQAGWINQVDYLTPVPVHRVRLRQRGYNQAQVLAEQIAMHTGIPLLMDGLIRNQERGSQVSRSRSERLRAMRNAFSAPNDLTGKRILLVDDVLTTGATAAACAKALSAAHAAEVRILTACRA